MDPYELPMFPLGSVLLPGGRLHLRVFEPRFSALMNDVMSGDHRFGVTLIERGSEVGGGDVRAGVGCVAEITEARPLGGGRWEVAASGTERITVVRWLDDDPYPRALVEPGAALEEPDRRIFAAAARLPLSPFDAYRLLTAPDTARRSALLNDAAEHVRELWESERGTD